MKRRASKETELGEFDGAVQPGRLRPGALGARSKRSNRLLGCLKRLDKVAVASATVLQVGGRRRLGG